MYFNLFAYDHLQSEGYGDKGIVRNRFCSWPLDNFLFTVFPREIIICKVSSARSGDRKGVETFPER